MDRQKAEAVRLRIVALLGRKVEMRVPSDLSAVEYRLEGQTIRISWERFEDHDNSAEIFPIQAVSFARNNGSFLLTTDGTIIPDET